MPPDYLLIDLENIVPDMIPGLLENQVVFIFTGSKQSKINRDLVISTQPFGKRIQTDRQFVFSSKGGVFIILFPQATAHLSTFFPATADLFKIANN